MTSFEQMVSPPASRAAKRDPELTELLRALLGTSASSAADGPFVVVAAHPDDETIGASWLLARAPGLTVVHVTDGAPRARSLWPSAAPATRAAYAALRRDETEAALALVGVPARRIRNLGVADQDASVALVEIAHALCQLLAALSPQVVVTHAYEGGHPDHDAAAFATRAALALLARAGAHRPWLLEMTAYHRREDALCTGAFLPGSGPEQARALRDEERTTKQQMFARYASQEAVLRDFRVDEERYRAAGPVRFDQPPHAGALHYELLGFAITGERFRQLAARALNRLDLTPHELSCAPSPS